jgi:glycosyltransferase involved in cell wall biosynthesis
MRDPRPKVSVVIPCFNRGPYLDDAVSSCVEAYAGPLEVVVVDDGSTDPRTERHLEALRSLPCELKVLRQENSGPARARNLGLSHCTGEFVQFLDSDDLLLKNKIEHQLHHLELAPDVDISVCDYWLCDDDRIGFERPSRSISPFGLTLDNFLFQWERGLTIPIHTALFRRSAFGAAPPWPEIVRGKEDWLFWVRLKMRGVQLAFLPLRLCVYRLHPNNMTREWFAMGLDFLRAAREIDGWTGGERPEFMRESMRWFVEFYANGAHRLPRMAPPVNPVSAAERRVIQAGALPGAPRADTDDAVRAAAASVSVVVPVFNHASYLRRCVLSAHRQTLAPREIICVDDGSTDPSVRPTLEALAAEIPELRLHFSERNQGISATQNLAVSLATGEFIAFLDCDDFVAPGAIEEVSRAIARHPDVDYFFTDRFEVDPEDRLVREAVYGGYPEHHSLDRKSHHENLLDAMIASHLKVIRRAKIAQVGGFDARTSGVQDWDLALKISEVGKLHYIPEPVYFHRVHAESVTLGRRVMMFRLTNEVRRRHQAVRSEKASGFDPRCASIESLSRLVETRAPLAQSREWDAVEQLWADLDAGLAISSGPRPAREAYRLWASWPTSVFLLQPGAPVETLAFLREFNSYFDLVVCADEGQWGALHRYMWDPRALLLGDELATSPAEEAGAPPRRASG